MSDDYIKREDAIDELASYYVPPTGTEETISKARQDAYKIAYKIMRPVPSADVAPVKHGYWIEYEPEHGRCSICGHKVDLMTPEDTHWCSNCGAKMDEVKYYE